MSEVEEALAAAPLLAGRSPEEVAELARLAVCRNYPRGNILFHDGDPAHTLFLVVSGHVKLSFVADAGREVTLNVMRQGELLGLIAALDGGPHVGTATTLADARLARFDRDDFQGWCRRHPGFFADIAPGMATALRQAYRHIGRQALYSVKQRLQAALVELARSQGRGGAGDEVTFVRPTHQELAELVGSSREVISRLFKELLDEDDGIMARGRVLRVRLLPPRDDEM